MNTETPTPMKSAKEWFQDFPHAKGWLMSRLADIRKIEEIQKDARKELERETIALHSQVEELRALTGNQLDVMIINGELRSKLLASELAKERMRVAVNKTINWGFALGEYIKDKVSYKVVIQLATESEQAVNEALSQSTPSVMLEEVVELALLIKSPDVRERVSELQHKATNLLKNIGR